MPVSEVQEGASFRFGRDMGRQISVSAGRIAGSGKRETVISETCRICSLLKFRRAFCGMHRKEDPGMGGCGFCRTTCLGRV